MIIIVGDSWGVGEWGIENNEYSLTGPGLGQYLMLHDQVVNLSQPGSSNSQALFRLDQFLNSYHCGEHDTFYWIVTDPQREITDVAKISDWDIGLEQKIQNILLELLDQANTIAIKHDINLNLIGGLCDLNTDWCNFYSNLNISVPSWTKFINSNHPESILWGCNNQWINLGEFIKQHCPTLLEEWLRLSDLIVKKEKSLWLTYKNRDYHPDRSAHIKLRNYLYPEHSNRY
jgi:hypothetical protein